MPLRPVARRPPIRPVPRRPVSRRPAAPERLTDPIQTVPSVHRNRIARDLANFRTALNLRAGKLHGT